MQSSFKLTSLYIVISAAVVLTLGFVVSFRAQAQKLAVSASPRVTVWAWQRDEDLSYIDPKRVSVAYFAGSIYVRGSLVRFRPRTQKLKLPEGVETIPVFRIESIRHDAVSEPNVDLSSDAEIIPDENAANFVAKTIARHLKTTTKIQIDFDALEDERPFYKTLLRNLRNELPAGTKISITSLASWLMADRWLEPGCADEAVAMLFSIGAGKRDVLTRLEKERLDSGAKIPIAIGISASEGKTNKTLFATNLQRKTGHLYIFCSRPWTESRLQAVINEALAK